LIKAHLKFDTIQGGIDEAQRKLDNLQESLEEAQRKLDSIQQGVDQANEKLDELLCPFGDNPGFTALRQGCDAIDQNCNGVRDECAEDNIPPTIALTIPFPDVPFKSTELAEAFLEENVQVSDDCAANFDTQISLLSEPDCCECQFQVTTQDTRCAVENPDGATSLRTFDVKVDSKAPVVTCGFFTQQDPRFISGGFDPCAGLPVPFPGENDPLHVDQTCYGPGLFDVEFWYQIEVRILIHNGFGAFS
jgi:hypothetical protein